MWHRSGGAAARSPRALVPHNDRNDRVPRSEATRVPNGDAVGHSGRLRCWTAAGKAPQAHCGHATKATASERPLLLRIGQRLPARAHYESPLPPRRASSAMHASPHSSASLPPAQWFEASTPIKRPPVVPKRSLPRMRSEPAVRSRQTSQSYARAGNPRPFA